MNTTTFAAAPTMQAHARAKTFASAAAALRFAEHAARQHGVSYAVWERWPLPRLLRTFAATKLRQRDREEATPSRRSRWPETANQQKEEPCSE
jgi:hypothetical protein